MLCVATWARCCCKRDLEGEGLDGLSSSPSSQAAGSPPGQGPAELPARPHPRAPNEPVISRE